MIIYLVFPFLLAGVYVGTRFLRSEKLKLFLCSFIPAILMFLLLALKGANVGADSQTYINAYHDLGSIPNFPSDEFFQSLKAYNFQNEYGFILFAQVFSKIGLPYLVFQIFVYSVICFCLFYSSWRLSKNPAFSLLIFFCFTFFNFYVSGLRQSFAMALCLFALSLVISGGRTPLRTVFYFLIVGLATFWHKSALIFIIPYFLIRIRVNLKAMIFLVFLSVFFFIFGGEMYEFINSLTSSLFEGNYGDYAPFSFGTGLTTILLIFIIAFSYFLYVDSRQKESIISFIERKIPFYQEEKQVQQTDPNTTDYLSDNVVQSNDEHNFSLYIILTFIGVWLSNTNRFSISFGRIGMYFSVFTMFLLSNSIERIRNQKIKYTFLIVFFVAFYGYFIYTAIIPNYLGIGPYTVIEGTI